MYVIIIFLIYLFPVTFLFLFFLLHYYVLYIILLKVYGYIVVLVKWGVEVVWDQLGVGVVSQATATALALLHHQHVEEGSGDSLHQFHDGCRNICGLLY